MSLFNCQINLNLTWSAEWVISKANTRKTFAITDAKLYVPVVTLSTSDSRKLLQQLKSGFERIFNWNKYQLKVTMQRQNQYLDYLIDPNFQGVNRLFLLSFENNMVKTGRKEYFLPKVEREDYNVMIAGQRFLLNH